VVRQHAESPGSRDVAERRSVGNLHYARSNTVFVQRGFVSGRVYKLTLDGKVLGMLGKSGRQLKQFGWIHEMACPSENEIYVAEILNWRVQKLLLHPANAKTD